MHAYLQWTMVSGNGSLQVQLFMQIRCIFYLWLLSLPSVAASFRESDLITCSFRYFWKKRQYLLALLFSKDSCNKNNKMCVLKWVRFIFGQFWKLKIWSQDGRRSWHFSDSFSRLSSLFQLLDFAGKLFFSLACNRPLHQYASLLPLCFTFSVPHV